MNGTLFHRLVSAFLTAILWLVPQANAQQSASPVDVAVTKPSRTSVVDHLESTGTFEASATAKIVARVDGTLEVVHFRDGSSVVKGESLFSIQRNTYEEQLKLYQAQLAQAQSEYARQLRLISKDATSQTRVESWRAKRDEAAANTQLAKINLGYTEIRAPFGGNIGKRLVDAGNLVGPNSGVTELAVLDQVDPIYLYFSINAPNSPEIRRRVLGSDLRTEPRGKDVKVQVALGNDADYRYVGSLDFVDTSIDESSGTIQLRAVLDNANSLFIPGQFARVKLDFGQPANRLVVPNRAVERDQAGAYVLIVDDQDIVRRKRVQVGEQQGEMRVINGGISADDRIIVKGLAYARPGKKVKVTEAKQ